MIAAVIFDFDGVLADTERLHFGAFVEVFAARGWTLDESSYYQRYIGYDDRGTVRAFAADHGVPLDLADVEAISSAKAGAFARLVASRDVLYPGAAETVRRLTPDFRLAIASGALHGEITAMLAAGGLLDAFPVIVGADDVAESKPSPVPYLTAAAGLGCAPRECVAVEDSHWGLTSARSAGMRTIALPTTSPVHLLGIADRILARLADLTPLIVAGLDPSSGLVIR